MLKQTEETLSESETKYRHLIENIPVVTWTSDREGNTLFVSRNVKNIIGYTPEEVCRGGVWFERIHPDDFERMLQSYTALFEEGKMYDVEYRYKRKDGRWIWLHERSISINDENGVFCTDGIFYDVSERKRAEEALQEAHDTLEQRVEERTAELAEAKERLEKLNTGLQVLIEHRQEEMKRLQENIMNNVNKLIMPYLEKIDKKRIGSKNRAYLEVIASGLKELVSPFTGTLSSKEVVLSPTEIQVANLIRQGKTSKEVAYLMNISANAITVHRYNIRRKLGLLNKKINLMAYLQNLPK